MPVGIALGRPEKYYDEARSSCLTLVTRKDRLNAFDRGQGATLHHKMVNPIQGPKTIFLFNESVRQTFPLTTRQDPFRTEKMMFLKGPAPLQGR